jgi:hypothetical protein
VKYSFHHSYVTTSAKYAPVISPSVSQPPLLPDLLMYVVSCYMVCLPEFSTRQLLLAVLHIIFATWFSGGCMYKL